MHDTCLGRCSCEASQAPQTHAEILDRHTFKNLSAQGSETKENNANFLLEVTLQNAAAAIEGLSASQKRWIKNLCHSGT
jgi:hypothetical protein